MSVFSVHPVGVRPTLEDVETEVLETILATDSLKTFATALKVAGNVPEIMWFNRPITVFAPTNKAFEQFRKEQSVPPEKEKNVRGHVPWSGKHPTKQKSLEDLFKPENKDRLESILLYHIIRGSFTYDDFKKEAMRFSMAQTMLFPTLAGHDVKIKLSSQILEVENVKIVKTVRCSDGVIHFIDSVIFPYNLYDTRPMPGSRFKRRYPQ